MFGRVVRSGVLLVCLGVLTGWGCSRTPSPIRPPAIDASAAGKLAIEQYDQDGDGLIQGQELSEAPALKAAIENLDTNHDGGVSADEITAIGYDDAAITQLTVDATTDRQRIGELSSCLRLGIDLQFTVRVTGIELFAPLGPGATSGRCSPGEVHEEHPWICQDTVIRFAIQP